MVAFYTIWANLIAFLFEGISSLKNFSWTRELHIGYSTILVRISEHYSSVKQLQRRVICRLFKFNSWRLCCLLISSRSCKQESFVSDSVPKFSKFKDKSFNWLFWLIASKTFTNDILKLESRFKWVKQQDYSTIWVIML